MNPQGKSALAWHRERGRGYEETVGLLMKQSCCVAIHWCGYVENKGGRGCGIADPFDKPYWAMMEAITACNRAILESESSM